MMATHARVLHSTRYCRLHRTYDGTYYIVYSHAETGHYMYLEAQDMTLGRAVGIVDRLTEWLSNGGRMYPIYRS